MDRPIIMELNPADGAMEEFFYIEHYQTSEVYMPTYETYAAIFKRETCNGDENTYAAFMMKDDEIDAEDKFFYLRIT